MVIKDHCIKCGVGINEKREPTDKPSARIVCDNCQGKNAMELETVTYDSPITTVRDNPPLLVIEVKDLNSVPVVRHKGKLLTGMIAVEYLWGTTTEVVGEHWYTIQHVIENDKDKIPLIRKLNEKRWI